MEKVVNGRTVEIEPNSRPYLLKRIIADGFDTVTLFLLFMVLTLLIMKTPLANAYNAHYERYMEIQNAAVETYQNDAEKITEVLNADEEYQYERFAATLQSYLLKVLAITVAELLLLVAVPLLNRYRATFGKLLTGIMPFSEKRQMRASWKQVVGRFLFVLILDSVFWYLLTGVFTFLLIPVIRLIEILLNRKHKTLCDWMSGIMIIEKISYDGIDELS